jgi:tetratricopeptide (TPR) repeat protein
MRKALLAVCVVLGLPACTSTEPQSPLLNNERQSVASTLEQKNRLADALIQWRVIQMLDPSSTSAAANIRRLEGKIDKRVKQLKAELTNLEKEGECAKKSCDISDENKNQRKTAMLNILALQPNNVEVKENLRSIIWDRALQDASEKTENIVKYFEENQRKAQKSIALVKLLEQGESFIESKKYKGLLQVAEKLEKSNPGHKDIQRFRFVALNSLGQQQLKSSQLVDGISYLEQAMTVATPAQKKSLQKQVAEVRQEEATSLYEEGLKVFKQDLSKAIAYFKQALAIDSNMKKAQAQLARAEKIQSNLLRIRGLQN